MTERDNSKDADLDSALLEISPHIVLSREWIETTQVLSQAENFATSLETTLFTMSVSLKHTNLFHSSTATVTEDSASKNSYKCSSHARITSLETLPSIDHLVELEDTTLSQEISNLPLPQSSNKRLISKEDSKDSRENSSFNTITPHSQPSDPLTDTTQEEWIPLTLDPSSDKMDTMLQRWSSLLSLEEWILMVMPSLTIVNFLSLLEEDLLEVQHLDPHQEPPQLIELVPIHHH